MLVEMSICEQALVSRLNSKSSSNTQNEICISNIFFFLCLGAAKKYHEHIRRTALGKITDETKKEKKKNLRKERVCHSL